MWPGYGLGIADLTLNGVSDSFVYRFDVPARKLPGISERFLVGV
jgi:hypothetical protein